MGIINQILALCKRPKPRKRVLAMIDLDNILLNIDTMAIDPRSFSLTEGFERVIRQIAKIGQLVKVLVYAPPETLSRNERLINELGFTAIQCPKLLVTKSDVKMEKIDTVDRRIIEDGKFFLREMPDITHFCLWSGDQDFIELLRAANECGKKIIIVAGNEKSLSSKLAKFAKAVYIFSAKADDSP